MSTDGIFGCYAFSTYIIGSPSFYLDAMLSLDSVGIVINLCV